MKRCAAIAVLMAGVVRAQAVDPAEFVHLEPVLRAAMLRAAPWVVTVETFGGTRRVLQGDPGMELPKPKERNDPEKPDKPDPPKLEPKDAPGQPKPDPGDEGDEDKKDKDKDKKAPLADPGFHQAQGRGTGIVLDPDGWILVSRFVLNYRPTTILVTIPGGPTLHAVKKGEDTSRGIALLKVEAEHLAAATFVDPATVRVGQWAFALGRTFGSDEPTVHFGIVSATRRQFGRALQIDAYTSPANYGGAVVDVDGNVLGIAVPLSPAGRDAGVEWYDSGIGFCATVADITPILARLKNGETLHRAWLGIGLFEGFLGPGAKIATAPRESAGAAAGLYMNDVILAVDGVPVRNGPHLQMLIGARTGGERVALTVQKHAGGEPIPVEVVLADVPSGERDENKDAELPASFPLPEKKDGR